MLWRCCHAHGSGVLVVYDSDEHGDGCPVCCLCDPCRDALDYEVERLKKRRDDLATINGELHDKLCRAREVLDDQ